MEAACFAQPLKLPTVDEALTHLGFFCQRRGIGMLVGKSGSGKSCLLRLLLAGLPTGRYWPVYLCHSTVSLSEFYGHLAGAFNLSPKGRRAALFRAVKEQAVQLHRSGKTHPLLIIDEAHCLSCSHGRRSRESGMDAAVFSRPTKSSSNSDSC